MQPLKAYKVY